MLMMFGTAISLNHEPTVFVRTTTLSIPVDLMNQIRPSTQLIPLFTLIRSGLVSLQNA